VIAKSVRRAQLAVHGCAEDVRSRVGCRGCQLRNSFANTQTNSIIETAEMNPGASAVNVSKRLPAAADCSGSSWTR
jgi:hypothetical protein